MWLSENAGAEYRQVIADWRSPMSMEQGRDDQLISIDLLFDDVGVAKILNELI